MKASDAFREDAPLPRAALDTLDYMNRKDQRIAELERKVEAASSYIDRIPQTWRMDIDLARELLHERGLTEEYEQRRLDYLRRLGEPTR